MQSETWSWVAVVGLILALVLTACTALRDQTPITRTRTFQESPETLYARATRAMARLGGKIVQANPQAGILSAEVHGTVILTVLVAPDATGSRLEVTGTLIPNKLTIGEFDEVDHFLALL